MASKTYLISLLVVVILVCMVDNMAFGLMKQLEAPDEQEQIDKLDMEFEDQLTYPCSDEVLCMSDATCLCDSSGRKVSEESYYGLSTWVYNERGDIVAQEWWAGNYLSMANYYIYDERGYLISLIRTNPRSDGSRWKVLYNFVYDEEGGRIGITADHFVNGTLDYCYLYNRPCLPPHEDCFPPYHDYPMREVECPID